MQNRLQELNVAAVSVFRWKLGEKPQDIVKTFIWGLKPEDIKDLSGLFAVCTCILLHFKL